MQVALTLGLNKIEYTDDIKAVVDEFMIVNQHCIPNNRMMIDLAKLVVDHCNSVIPLGFELFGA
jgi:hypothetical protein